MDAAPGRASVGQSHAHPAQVCVVRRVLRQHAAPPQEHRGHHAPGDRRPRTHVRHCGAGKHPVRSGAPRYFAHLSRQAGFHERRARQSAAQGGGSGAVCRDSRGDAIDRAHVDRRVLRRLLHAVRFHRRHPQIHAGAGRGLCAPRRNAADEYRGDRDRRHSGRTRRDAGECRNGGARRDARRRRGDSVCGGRQPGAGRHRGRPGEHLSGEGLLHHCESSGRRQPRRRTDRESARRCGENRDEPAGG